MDGRGVVRELFRGAYGESGLFASKVLIILDRGEWGLLASLVVEAWYTGIV